MKEEDIRQIIEQSDPENKIPRNIVDDIIYSLEQIEVPKEEVKEVDEKVDLGGYLLMEPDWRKRAAAVAKKISDGLA